jgi:rhamnulokinase
LLGAEIDRPILGDAARAANFTNEGGTHGRIRFLKNITGLWLIQECQRMWAANGDPISFADIAVAAADAADFPSVIDPNDNRFMAPDNMLEAVAAACAESGQPVPASIGQTARCCYQSVAVACADNLKLLEKVTERSFSRLHIVGGGTQATLLNQLTADACGIPVIAGPVEATAIGNICVQAMGHGLFSGLDDMRRRIARSFPLQTYEPH